MRIDVAVQLLGLAFVVAFAAIAVALLLWPPLGLLVPGAALLGLGHLMESRSHA